MDTVDPGGRLLRQAVCYGGWWTLAMAEVALLNVAAELLLPAALGLAIDAALLPDSPKWPWLTAACGLVAVAFVTEVLGDLATGYNSAHATARVRQRLLRHLFALDTRTAGRHPVGDLVGRLVAQAANAGQAGSAVVLGLIALLPPLGSVVALFLLSPALGLTLVVGLALLALVMRAFVSEASTVASDYQRMQGMIAGRLLESLGGARTIAAAATVRQEITRVLAALPGLRGHGLHSWELLARAAARTTTAASLLRLAVIGVGGYALTAGWLTPGQLVAAVQYAALGAGVGTAVATLNRLARSRAGAQRVAEVLSLPAAPDGVEPLPAGHGALRLRHVGVQSANGRPILHDISLAVPGGSTVAVVGESGSGKSTLAAVAGRLYDPDAGEVLLDGRPLRRLDPTALRRAVGYGFERPVLVGDTVHEAIGLGLSTEDAPAGAGNSASAVDDRVRRAARAAAVDGWVDRLPDGYHTRLVSAPLSGGEAQRLGLARALHAERLLILDDATSSVDTATEHRIARAVASRSDGRTRLIVTHRVATAAAADLVAWLDQGRLRALAPHHELWTDQAYRRIFLAERSGR